jgi:fructoselysine 6-kinase
MVRIIGVGDNTVDTYVHQGIMFPGGNSVNVPVLAKRYGADTSYIGCLGNDFRGRHILKALDEEGVDVSHVKMMDGPNAWCEVFLVDNDRVFGKSTKGVSIDLVLTEDDYHFIEQHQLTHTSIYSRIETQLPTVSKRSSLTSFDFSSSWTKEYLEKNLSWVDLAFLSYPSNLTENVEDFMKWVFSLGPQLVVVTLGKRGSKAYDGETMYSQGIVETKVVDTLGAGDAFIARFLVEYLQGQSIRDALAKAAISGAETCSYFGAFGHGMPITNTT